MRVELKPMTIRDLVDGYSYRNEDGNIVPLDEGNQEFGVVGYRGLLDIRPPYQREFVYNDKQRNKVIDSVLNNFPISIMYWVETGDGHYELMDGQQRTMSICEYHAGNFSIEYDIDGSGKMQSMYFHNLPKNLQEDFLDYQLLVYVCEGTDEEKLSWFNIINIAGEELTDQELRNAVYTGPWLIDAKSYFSKTGCGAYELYSDYMKGTPIRQDYLETVLSWISDREDTTIEEYMAKHQNDKNASELWQYFSEVMDWVKRTFPNYRRKEMKGLNWGILFNKYKDKKLNAVDTEERIKELMIDDDVTRKRGIYEYILSGDERHLNIRKFTPQMRTQVYERQNGICVKCKEKFDIKDMEADHVTPWSKGGSTTPENCQMLCKGCNRRKSDK